MTENGDWLRARGIGRERFAGYVSDYLTTLGYVVERSELTEPAETHLNARMGRMNPSVPPSAKELGFRLYPTSGGSALVWQAPTSIDHGDQARMDRLVREISTHLERAIATESHATAKILKPAASHLPWETKTASPPSS
jgi:hypothetical protein